MAGLLDTLQQINTLASRATMPVDPYLIPANARMLAKSVFMPTKVTEQNFSPEELNAQRQAVLNSQTRSQNATKESWDWLNTLKSMEDTDKVQSRFSRTEGQFVPAVSEYENVIRSISPTIQYPDYPISHKYDKYGIGDMPVSASLLDPAYSMSTTVGRAKYYTDAQGNTHVIDTYDFPRGQGMADYQNWSMPFKLAHGFGEQFSQSMPVDINLGKLNKKKTK